ncbi:MAG: TIGR00296 family protein [Candidatus Aenigmatarchaeota archaeon]|nr:MAG: TIGR00296 family protein [Candidatus Aenigmarchaeota archaeon]
MSLKEGKALVRAAREVIEKWVRKRERFLPEKYPETWNEKRGVFVTIHSYPDNNLRGCIGYPEPVMPLIKALVESAIQATQDPRFPELKENELDNIVVEVSVLTKPELIKVENPKEYPERIETGKDGLIVRKGFYSGLLLPQVATEHGMNEEEFLSHTCMKAGLTPDAWLDPETKVYKFQAEIFKEAEPKGEVVRK